MIHFEYDGASTLFFKVLDAKGCRLEYCRGEDGQGVDAAGAGPAIHSSSDSADDGRDARGSSISSKLYETPETSDDSYAPPSSCRARSKAAASGRRRH